MENPPAVQRGGEDRLQGSGDRAFPAGRSARSAISSRERVGPRHPTRAPRGLLSDVEVSAGDSANRPRGAARPPVRVVLPCRPSRRRRGSMTTARRRATRHDVRARRTLSATQPLSPRAARSPAAPAPRPAVADAVSGRVATSSSAGPERATVIFVGKQPSDQEEQLGALVRQQPAELLQRRAREGGQSMGVSIPPRSAVRALRCGASTKSQRRIHGHQMARGSARGVRGSEEVEVIKARAIVVLGAVAAPSLLGESFHVARRRGTPWNRSWAAPSSRQCIPGPCFRAPDGERAQARHDFFADVWPRWPDAWPRRPDRWREASGCACSVAPCSLGALARPFHRCSASF